MEHQNFIRSCQTQFRRSPADFPTDEDKVLYAMEYLEGAPRDAWYRVDENRQDVDYSWPEFVKFLRDLIIDPMNREMDVQQRYTDAKQKPSQTAQEFDIYLSNLENQLEVQTELTRRDAYLTRLRDDLRHVIKNQVTIPLTRIEIVSLAARIERNEKDYRDHKRDGGEKSNTSTSQNRRSNEGRQGSARGRQRSSGEGPKKADFQKTVHIHSTTKDQSGSDDWKKDAVCYNCGKKGHISRDCRSPKKDDGMNYKPVHVNRLSAKNGPTALKSPEQSKASRSHALKTESK